MLKCPHGMTARVFKVNVPKNFHPTDGVDYWSVKCGHGCAENKFFTDAFPSKDQAIKDWDRCVMDAVKKEKQNDQQK